jgi:predicted PurR-regulated permease PerM
MNDDIDLQRKTFLFLLLAATLAFLAVIWPFAGTVLWAVVLAILFAPLYRRLLKRTRGGRNQAAFATLLVIMVGVLLPVAFITTALVQEAAQVYQDVQAKRIDVGGWLQQVLQAMPGWLQNLLNRVGIGDLAAVQQKLAAGAGEASRFIATRAVSIGQNTFEFLVAIAVMLYMLYFLLRDGDEVAGAVEHALPLASSHKSYLIDTFATVIRATVKGNVVVAVVQGAIGGVALALLGIHAALLWGVLMAFLSLLPAVGAAMVWAPIAAYLLLTGAIWQGVTLIAVGVLVIGLVDNILRPILVGKDTRMPDYLVLLSTLGGIALFGISGFVIGPVIAALFLAVWKLQSSPHGEAKGESGSGTVRHAQADFTAEAQRTQRSQRKRKRPSSSS